ncbi:PLD-like domain-containing protein [Sarocladium implicatum]|nr:PLD-like domain-containing protein [Sarocladium implicatum]
MEGSSFPQSFIQPWRELLKSTQEHQMDDFPNYHVFDSDSLVTTSVPKTLLVGTGLSIFSRGLLPSILKAQRSVHFVTCYWADSPSLDAFRNTLLSLAELRKRDGVTSALKITIGFSSHGLFQKLFHTASQDGHVYPSSEWPALGLPDEQVLRDARIDMTVKSLFFTPLSVMHSKYLVVDEKEAWIPSCNVSWERWFEGCIAVEGGIVGKIMTFHDKVWRPPRGSTFGDVYEASNPVQSLPQPDDSDRYPDQGNPGSACQSCKFDNDRPVPTIFLPSPHHRNPRFSIFPFLTQRRPPMTPLNAALLTLIENAQQQITILTPNVTSWPALDALLAALARGVNVHIRTSKDVMFIEQLVTAGTWTSRCLGQFIDKYNDLLDKSKTADNIEGAPSKPGRLETSYFTESSARSGHDDEPVVSHFKMTVVDNEYFVFGSGNMDRASWWTSQEIGVLIHAPGFEGTQVWESVLATRTETLYRSRDD